MSVDTMMSMGAPAGLADAIAGGTKGSVTATGSTISDAAALSADTTLVTGISGGGVQLPNKKGIFAVGVKTQDTVVYPHSASGQINGGSAGAGMTITAGDGGLFIRLDDTNWIGIGETG